MFYAHTANLVAIIFIFNDLTKMASGSKQRTTANTHFFIVAKTIGRIRGLLTPPFLLFAQNKNYMITVPNNLLKLSVTFESNRFFFPFFCLFS